MIQNMRSTPLTDPAFNQALAVTLFDDFCDGQHQSGNGYGAGLYFRGSGNASGGLQNGSANPATEFAATSGRIGIIGLSTGQASNHTGQGFIDSSSMQFYLGQVGLTLQWAFNIATLNDGTSGKNYIVEMGIGSGYAAGGAAFGTNGAGIIYNLGVGSSFFAAVTSQNASSHLITTTSTTFAPTVNSWWNAKMYCHPDGSAVDFYLAPSGQPYQLLGTSTTFLPNGVSYAVNPVFNIYKTGATVTTTANILGMDWVRMDVTGFNR